MHVVHCDGQSVVCIFVHVDKLLLCGMVGNIEKTLWDGEWMWISSTDILDCPVPTLYWTVRLKEQKSPSCAVMQPISWWRALLQRPHAVTCHLASPAFRDSLFPWSQHHLVNALNPPLTWQQSVNLVFACILQHIPVLGSPFLLLRFVNDPGNSFFLSVSVCLSYSSVREGLSVSERSSTPLLVSLDVIATCSNRLIVTV